MVPGSVGRGPSRSIINRGGVASATSWTPWGAWVSSIVSRRPEPIGSTWTLRTSSQRVSTAAPASAGALAVSWAGLMDRHAAHTTSRTTAPPNRLIISPSRRPQLHRDLVQPMLPVVVDGVLGDEHPPPLDLLHVAAVRA